MNRPDASAPRRAFVRAALEAAPRTVQPAAIALAYAGEDAAPRVVAKGRGLVAQAIIERARTHGVYVHESRELVALLMQVDIDQRIPPQLYRAVAELLAWVYRLEQQNAARAAHRSSSAGML